MKLGYSATSTAKVTAEWNHNVFNKPRIVGSLNTAPSATFAALTFTGYTEVTTLRSTAQNYTVNSFTEEVSLSPTLSNSFSNSNYINFDVAAGVAYKFSFYAKNTSSTSLSKKLFMKVEEFSDTVANNVSAVTLNKLSSTSFDIDGADYSYFTWTYYPTQLATMTTKQVRIYFASDLSSNQVNISDLSVSKITPNEYYNSHLYSVNDTFSGFRPGDGILENSSTNPLSEVIYRGGFGNDAAIYTSNGRVYAPEIGRLSYYCDTFTTATTHSGVYAYYDTTIKTNKIVLKFLNGNNASKNAYYNNNINAYTVYKYSAGSWTSIYSTIGDLRSNGGLIIYYNGSTWSTTDVSSTISADGKTLSNTVSIDGIAVVVTDLGYHNGSTYTKLSTSNTLSTTPFDPTVRFLELSPRLQVDLSTYLNSFSVDKETDSGDLPLPVGLATSNNCSIDFINIPIGDAISSFSLFSDTSKNSALTNLINRDIKFKITHTMTNNQDGTTDANIPMFIGYAESWNISDTSATANVFDVAKYLQEKKSVDLLLINTGTSDMSISGILEDMLQQNGFSDYNAFPSSMSSIKLNTFYAENNKTVWEVVQELLTPFMYYGFIDETGRLTVSSYADNISTSPVFKFTDTPISSTYISNIISFAPENNVKPSSVSVRFNALESSFSTDIVSNDIENNKVATTRTKTQVWEAPQEGGLGFAKLKTSIGSSDTTLILDFADNNPAHGWVSFSGYLIIGSEIIKYDGLEIAYTNTDGTGGVQTVKSSQDFRSLVASINQSQQVNSNRTTTFTYTGKLMNVERGKFGTKAVPHIIFDSAITANLSAMTGVWSTPNPIMKVQTIPNRAAGKAFGTPTTQTLSTDWVKPGISNFNKERAFKVSGSVASTSSTRTAYGQVRLMWDGSDNPSYNTYGFRFSVPVDDKEAIRHEESVGCFIKYDATTGKGIFFEISPGSNSSLTADASLYTVSSTGVRKVLATSNITLDKKSVDKLTKYKKKDGKYILKDGKKVIESAPTHWEMFENVKITYNKSSVKVFLNKKVIKWKSTNSSEVAVGSFSGTAMGVYASENSVIDLQTIYAKGDNSFVVSPEISKIDLSWVSNRGKLVDTPAFYVAASPTAFGMQLFDVEIQSGPSYSHEVLKTVGGFEIPSGKNQTRLLKLTESSSVVSPLSATPYHARFAYLNVSPMIIPFSGESFSALKISANAIVKSDEMVVTKKIESPQYSSNSASIELQSDWIQTEYNANQSLANIVNGIKTSMDVYSIDVFGNPLITIGDVVNLYFNQSGFNATGTTNPDSKYMVVGTAHTFDGGYSTKVKLRRILA